MRLRFRSRADSRRGALQKAIRASWYLQLRAAIVLVALIAIVAGGIYAYDRWLSDDDSAEARPLVTAPVERRTLRQTVEGY
ncbi:MAG: hypothetical protein ACRDHF_01775 [Tepidiformaceae bacterium]